jgi:pimeloyl-ACP methyl ester carboxylesterase
MTAMDRLRSTSAASALPHDEAGSGPAIVLLHAGIADRSMWAEQLEPLAAAGHRVVALEEHPELLAGLDIPVLVAAGDHDMPDFLDAAEQLAAALPRAQHAVIAGAGHLAPLETPAVFRELLLGFLG